MIERIPSTLQSSDCTFSTVPDSSADSTFCSAEVPQDTISSLLDHYSDQLEPNLQLSSQFHGLKGNLAICESHNLRLGADNHQFAVSNANLASEISRLQAEITQLQLKAKPTLEQQQAMLVCSAAVQDFRTAASRPTVDTHICTDSRFRPPTTSGSSATRAFRHQRLWLTMALARTSVSVDGGRLILRQDPRPSSRSPGVFGMLRLDPKTVLTLLTTTRIPGRFYRTGTVVGPRNVDDLRSCAVTSTVRPSPFFLSSI